MSIFQPFAFQQGPASAGGGWDPTLGGIITPAYWWDLQDSSPSNMVLTGTSIDTLYNKGSQTNGTLTSNYTKPTFGLDSLGKNAGNFVGGTLGSSLTLIPHLQNCTVFVAFNPTNGGSSEQYVFAHEGYTFQGSFATLLRYTSSKTEFDNEQYVINNVLYPEGTAATIPPYSSVTDTRPLAQYYPAVWTRAGVAGLTAEQMYGTMHTQISTRDWGLIVPNSVTVQMAFDTNTMGLAAHTDFPLAVTSNGTSIQYGYFGAVYTVVVYFQKLTQSQITQLYNGWNFSF